MEYPALVVYYTMCLISAKAITKTWRGRLRHKQREKYTLEQSVLKDYCCLEIMNQHEKYKKLRYFNRLEIAKMTKRLHIPEDINREIISFTFWKISY
jgi:hypothetical protein